MTYQDNSYKSVRTKDHETYFGYPSKEMHHPSTQKSTIFGGEYSSCGVRQELKKNEKAHRELLEHIKKLGEYYNN